MRAQEHWEKIGFHHHHGIALPLFSLLSKQSCGIGEFFDLLPIIDWCKSLSLDVIQLLPINDTAYDPSPYNPISACALDPIYLSLHRLFEAETIQPHLSIFAPFNSQRRVAKVELKGLKMKWLYAYFQKMFEEVSKSEDYQKFISESSWLLEYAVFKALKDEYGGKSWTEWPQKYQSPNIENLAKEKQDAVHFHSFVQYLCFLQMGQVREYASNQKVFLKGDVPILISPDSAGVWAHRNLFNLDFHAGAPPDFYNMYGQDWGFPLFRWDEIRKENFSWWKQRLSVTEKLYHLYRIDHVVGFFRIWAIAPGKSPSEGLFIEEDSKLWDPQGREILEMMIDTCSLLPIAEDLGTIPKGVRPLLRELGISSTNVIRWERHWDTNGSYIPYEQYDPMSLTTISTADADVTKMWWKKYPDEALSFCHFKNWTYHADLSDEHLFEILRDSHHTPSFFHINLLQEYLSLFQDLSAPNLDDERVNVPGTILPTNWTGRYRPSVEELIGHEKLANTIKEIIK